MKSLPAFSLIEVLAVSVVLAVLAMLGIGAYRAGLAAGDRARSASNLKVLILAAQLYATENRGEMPRYREDDPTTGDTSWWFGLESASSRRRAEGKREIQAERGPLGPYLGTFAQGGPCPGLAREGRVIPKYRNSRNFGYGYNELLGPDRWQRGSTARAPWKLSEITQPVRIAVFGTCAQRKPGHPPPTLEEFYLINERERTVHARFGKEALFAFADGHVSTLPLISGSEDPALGSIRIGRVTPSSLDPALQP